MARKFDWKIFLRLLVTVGLVVFLFWWLKRSNNLPLVLTHLRHINPWWLVLSAATFFVSLLLSTLQWHLLLSIQGIKLPFRRTFGFYMIGQFFSNFLPTSWGGDFVRIYDLGIYNKEWEKGTASIVMDRLLGFILLFVIGLVCAFTRYWDSLKKWNWLVIVLAAGFLLGLIFFILFDMKIVAGWLRKARVPSPIIMKVLHFAERFFSSLELYQREPWTLAVLPVALATQYLRILMNVFIGIGLGVLLPYDSYFLIIPIIGLVTALPITINGVGVREWMGPLLVSVFLPARTAEGGLSVIIFTISYLVIVAVSLIGGVYFILYRIRKAREPGHRHEAT